MKRSQLFKDFEETFKTQFELGYMYIGKQQSEGGRLEYLDELTRSKFSIWVCAFETYSTDYVEGD